MKIEFEGAAQTVTGSQTVVSHRGYTSLVDCGLYQAPKPLRLLNWEKPTYFSDINSIVLTHAHIDHSGLLPRWSYWGWKGPVYCRDLAGNEGSPRGFSGVCTQKSNLDS